MRGVSWRRDPRCPAFADLALLSVPHWTFNNEPATGEMVVAADVAEDVLDVFAALWAARFPIESMRRIDEFGADDERSMAANNSSAFCFRDIARGGGLSKHALGHAIDINPIQNPYLVDGQVLPESGRAYLDRTDIRPGMIVRPSAVIDAFAAIGWEWGGDWTTKSDYHHFARR